MVCAMGQQNSKMRIGEAVQNFSLPGTGERTVSVKELKGQIVVFYFYPRDATPGCTLEGHDFSKLLPQFAKNGAQVFGISRDTIKSHEKFREKEKYKIDLLSDEDEKICKMFDVIKMKNMYGKQVRGIERSTFVIDKKGKLVKEWRKLKVPGHAQEVLEFIKTL